MNSNKLLKLSQMAGNWGGKVVFDKEIFARAQRAPFTGDILGTIWDEKVVVSYAEEVNWTAVLHEMGHVFACYTHPIEDELQFFGWEYLIAKKLGGVREWMEANEDYGVPHPDSKVIVEFGDLDGQQKQELLQWCVGLGREVGNIVNGDPVAIR